MKVRFVVDRIVLEGMALSREERTALEGELRASIETSVRRLVGPRNGSISGRRVPCERLDLSAPSAAVPGLGHVLGSALGDLVLSQESAPSRKLP